MKKDIVTLRDVAKKCGLSVGTVSRYINNEENIKEKNKERIRSVIEDLGYIPNNLARNFAKRQSRQIILFIAAEFPISSSTWLYGLPIIQSVNNVLRDKGYSLQMTVCSITDKEKNDENIRSMVNTRSIDGLLYFSAWGIPVETIDFLDKNRFPYILVANNNPKKPENDVLINNFSAIKNIVEYLYENNHRKMGMIIGFKEQLHMVERLNTFYRETRRLKIKVNERHVKMCNFDISGGYESMNEIISAGDLPSAIICGNDDIATGAIRALKEKGYDVPEDISITGFDNSILCQVTEPSITTIEIPAVDIGRESALNLLDRINNPGSSIPRKVIDCTLIKGNSVAESSRI